MSQARLDGTVEGVGLRDGNKMIFKVPSSPNYSGILCPSPLGPQPCSRALKHNNKGSLLPPLRAQVPRVHSVLSFRKPRVILSPELSLVLSAGPHSETCTLQVTLSWPGAASIPLEPVIAFAHPAAPGSQAIVGVQRSHRSDR